MPFTQPQYRFVACPTFDASGGAKTPLGVYALTQVELNFVAISANVPNDTAASTPTASSTRRARKALTQRRPRSPRL